MSMQPYVEPVPLEHRRWLLEHEIAKSVGNGATISYRTADLAVLTYGQPVNHAVHAIVTIFMCGLWLPFWLLFAFVGGQQRVTVWVDDHGQVQRANGART